MDTPKADESTDKLRECDGDRGEGVRNTTFLRTSYVPSKRKKLRLGPYVPRVLKSLVRPVAWCILEIPICFPQRFANF